LKESSRFCPECGCENAMYPKDPADRAVQAVSQETESGQAAQIPPVPEEEVQELQVDSSSDPVVPPVRRPEPIVYAEVSAQRREGSHPFAVLSTWSYVWSFLLLMIPVAGLLTAIVWACGGVHSQNRRHMGRAYLILFAGWVLLTVGIGIGLFIQLYGNGMLYPWLY